MGINKYIVTLTLGSFYQSGHTALGGLSNRLVKVPYVFFFCPAYYIVLDVFLPGRSIYPKGLSTWHITLPLKVLVPAGYVIQCDLLGKRIVSGI